MRILFNTKIKPLDSMAAKICIEELSEELTSQGFDVTLNDWDNYQDYDVCIFMPYDSDIAAARVQNSNIKIGIVDPKLTNSREVAATESADFLLVSSVEQYDIFLKYSKYIFIYYMFSKQAHRLKRHQYKEKIILGYHGNKIHLNCSYPYLTIALDNLAQHYDIELWAIYNIDHLGKWTHGVPSCVKVKHIQWTDTIYEEIFSEIDIGIVPNFIDNNFKDYWFYPKKLSLQSSNDYIVRYKYSSNPGRQYIYAINGIPIVSDMYPSSSQFLFHMQSGELVASSEGWYSSIERLILSHDLRNKYAMEAYKIFNSHSDTKRVKNLIEFISSIPVGEKKIQLKQYSFYNLHMSTLKEFAAKIKRKIRTKQR
jgi:hypothetical protein